MIAIDTNVLVRLMVNDSPQQALLAQKRIQQEGLVFIPLIVMVETAWVLSSVYDLSKAELIRTMEEILSVSQFSVENSDIIWRALADFKKSNADFSDCVISRSAQLHDCKITVTFDKKAAQVPGFQLLVS